MFGTDYSRPAGRPTEKTGTRLPILSDSRILGIRFERGEIHDFSRGLRNDKLATLEAMKMQSTIYAPKAGTVTGVLVQPGEQVEAKDLLLEIEG